MFAQRVSAGTRIPQVRQTFPNPLWPNSSSAECITLEFPPPPNTSSFQKNNPLPPHPAYNKGVRTSNHPILSHLGSLLVVLCLLAAPLCATRCTLSSCAKPSTQEQSTTGCHHQSKHSRGSSVLAATIAPTCLPADSLLTTLPAQQYRLLSTDSDSHSLSAILNSPSISETSSMIAFRISHRSSSPGDSASFFLNSPLRL